MESRTANRVALAIFAVCALHWATRDLSAATPSPAAAGSRAPAEAGDKYQLVCSTGFIAISVLVSTVNLQLSQIHGVTGVSAPSVFQRSNGETSVCVTVSER